MANALQAGIIGSQTLSVDEAALQLQVAELQRKRSGSKKPDLFRYTCCPGFAVAKNKVNAWTCEVMRAVVDSSLRANSNLAR